jgi:hypothetical protein
VIAVSNPYGNLDLRIPENEWDSFRVFTTTFKTDAGAPADIDRSPFNRYVDLWWAALCVGVHEGRRTIPSKWHSFVTGVVLNQDPWRIRQLELIAMAEEGEDILREPGKVVMIGNEYAATGVPSLIDAMTGQIEAIWSVTTLIRSIVEQSRDKAAP